MPFPTSVMALLAADEPLTLCLLI